MTAHVQFPRGPTGMNRFSPAAPPKAPQDAGGGNECASLGGSSDAGALGVFALLLWAISAFMVTTRATKPAAKASPAATTPAKGSAAKMPAALARATYGGASTPAGGAAAASATPTKPVSTKGRAATKAPAATKESVEREAAAFALERARLSASCAAGPTRGAAAAKAKAAAKAARAKKAAKAAKAKAKAKAAKKAKKAAEGSLFASTSRTLASLFASASASFLGQILASMYVRIVLASTIALEAIIFALQAVIFAFKALIVFPFGFVALVLWHAAVGFYLPVVVFGLLSLLRYYYDLCAALTTAAGYPFLLGLAAARPRVGLLFGVFFYMPTIVSGFSTWWWTYYECSARATTTASYRFLLGLSAARPRVGLVFGLLVYFPVIVARLAGPPMAPSTMDIINRFIKEYEDMEWELSGNKPRKNKSKQAPKKNKNNASKPTKSKKKTKTSKKAGGGNGGGGDGDDDDSDDDGAGGKGGGGDAPSPGRGGGAPRVTTKAQLDVALNAALKAKADAKGVELPPAWLQGAAAAPNDVDRDPLASSSTSSDAVKTSLTKLWDSSVPITIRQKFLLLLLLNDATLYGSSVAHMLNLNATWASDYDFWMGELTLKQMVKATFKLLENLGLEPDFKNGGPLKGLATIIVKVGGETYEFQPSYQPSFNSVDGRANLARVFDTDCLTARLHDDDEICFEFHDEVERDGLAVGALRDVLDRATKMESNMIASAADLKCWRLNTKMCNRAVHKVENGWTLSYPRLKGSRLKQLERDLEFHTKVPSREGGRFGFRGYKSMMMEIIVITKLADELVRSDSPLRLVRAPDNDEVVDFVLVAKGDYDEAALEGRVPNLAYGGLGLPGQMKTIRGLSADCWIRRTSEASLRHYGNVIYVHYDFERGEFLVVERGDELADRVEDGRKVGRRDIESNCRSNEDDSARAAVRRISLDSRHPDGAALWEEHGVSLKGLVTKLEEFWKHDQGKATYEDMFSTPEIEELTLLQRLLGSDATVRLTPLPQQMVDAFVDVAGRSLELQAKATGAKDGNRFRFDMKEIYESTSFDFFLLTIRDEERTIRGFFLLPTWVLYRHRFFPGQLKRKSSENRATKEPVEIEQMQQIRVFAMVGGIQLPGLEPVREREVSTEMWAFMKDASKYYFKVDAAGALSKAKAKQLVSIVKHEPPELSDVRVVQLRNVPVVPMMLHDAGMFKCYGKYVCGEASLAYNGQSFFYGDAWVVSVMPNSHKYRAQSDVPIDLRNRKKGSIEHLEFRLYPPMAYFLKPQFHSLTYAEVTDARSVGYTMVPEKALALAKAFAAGGADAAIQEMYDLKGPCPALKKILVHQGRAFRPRPDILAEEPKKKRTKPAPPAREGSKRVRSAPEGYDPSAKGQPQSLSDPRGSSGGRR